MCGCVCLCACNNVFVCVCSNVCAGVLMCVCVLCQRATVLWQLAFIEKKKLYRVRVTRYIEQFLYVRKDSIRVSQQTYFLRLSWNLTIRVFIVCMGQVPIIRLFYWLMRREIFFLYFVLIYDLVGLSHL